MTQPGWKALNVGIVGGGIGGLAAATALRRQGHFVTVYERADFAGEVGASISCAANGTKWLQEWDVNIDMGDPVILQKLISRNWKTGEPTNIYDLENYKERWGYNYYMFHRQYMHAMLMDSAVGQRGSGQPAKLVVNHKATGLDVDAGTITFTNGAVATHDVIIGADGIGSAIRSLLGIKVEKRAASWSCLHTNVDTDEAVKLGLVDYSKNNAIEYWGGYESPDTADCHYKIVLSPCNGGKLLSYYCFFPREAGDFQNQSWDEAATLEELLAPYPTLDRQVFKHLEIGYEIRPWRLWKHDPYPFWQQGLVAIIGDAAHPMMPDQSQGACQSIEDAGAIGTVFTKKNFNGNIREALEVYEDIRKPRGTKVQAASARASENIHERIGFSSNKENPLYKVDNEDQKLTIEEMNLFDMHKEVEKRLAARRSSNILAQ